MSLSGQQLYRFVLPAGIELSTFAWTPDSSQLAIIRNWTANDLSPNGGESFFSPTTQDAMGLLEPNQNPYLQKNALQTFNLKTGQQHLIHASKGDNAAFSDLTWSPDGKTLLVRAIYSPSSALCSRQRSMYAN
ncbi:MAG: hypothetical protein HC866_15480 [Leptolyngbyaceae cyanobacterium RU_5_1]|nr:hypothetical protein [Leptolyngbyaceae cyanobacterium RU_5_1]